MTRGASRRDTDGWGAFLIEVVNEGTREEQELEQVKLSRWGKLLTWGAGLGLAVWFVWPWLT
jgi:hypothetical protein